MKYYSFSTGIICILLLLGCKTPDEQEAFKKLIQSEASKFIQTAPTLSPNNALQAFYQLNTIFQYQPEESQQISATSFTFKKFLVANDYGAGTITLLFSLDDEQHHQDSRYSVSFIPHLPSPDLNLAAFITPLMAGYEKIEGWNGRPTWKVNDGYIEINGAVISYKSKAKPQE